MRSKEGYVKNRRWMVIETNAACAFDTTGRFGNSKAPVFLRMEVFVGLGRSCLAGFYCYLH